MYCSPSSKHPSPCKCPPHPFSVLALTPVFWHVNFKCCLLGSIWYMYNVLLQSFPLPDYLVHLHVVSLDSFAVCGCAPSMHARTHACTYAHTHECPTYVFICSSRVQSGDGCLVHPLGLVTEVQGGWPGAGTERCVTVGHPVCPDQATWGRDVYTG